MKERFNTIIVEETKFLEKLLVALEKQHEYITKNEVFKMEAVVEEIQNLNIEIAKWEMERRNLTKGRGMLEIVEELGDSEIENNYRKIRALVEELKTQKELNEALIRQGLGYTTKMLQILNPDRSPKTYGAYGKMK
ncbi:flagellar protein FlgN [uncultured Clostridium sp.]|uniref:flagellar protein FlgN n=1 Tax=uncultured Clostridium sp. TaxID=59620 RepID=UPI0028F055BE|nr:flagellar protein FlgN [uncultured Clostridium sp.]